MATKRQFRRYLIASICIFMIMFLPFIIRTRFELFLKLTNVHKDIEKQNVFPQRNTTELLSKRWDTSELKPSLEFVTDCYDLYSESLKSHRVEWFNISGGDKCDHTDVTMLLHGGLDRLGVLERTFAFWAGPISMAIWVTEDNLNTTRRKLVELVGNRSNVAIHFVVRTDENYYPVNLMRNVAYFGSSCTHVWMVDMDFIPIPKSYGNIKHYISQSGFKLNSNKTAFVVPAFDSTIQELDPYPLNKDDLLHLYKKEKVTIFTQKVCRSCQAPTDYKKWTSATEIYQVKHKKLYEPYVLIQRKTMPLYDERFIGRFRDKITFTAELNALGYSFYVLPDVYILHYKHPRAPISSHEMKCMMPLGDKIEEYQYNKH